jgi:hypothetical protein
MCRVRLEGAIKKGKIKRYSAAVKEEGGVNERGEGGRVREIKKYGDNRKVFRTGKRVLRSQCSSRLCTAVWMCVCKRDCECV